MEHHDAWWSTGSRAPLERSEQQLGVHGADQLAQRLGARGDDLHGALDVDLPREPLSSTRHLLLDQRLQRLAVAQRVVDGEAERLLVAAGPEAARSPR